MIDRMTQAQLDELKAKMGPEMRAIADGLEARNDPAEMADMIVLLALISLVKKGNALAGGQQLDIVKECLSLASITTVYKTCKTLTEEGAGGALVGMLGLEAFGEMRKGVERIALFRELLKPASVA